jgi:UDP-4-amino-4,6-dideoxy-N-acetyl-beta-L-altrosamine transaminase
MTANQPSTRPVLPYGRQSIDDDDIAAVVAVLTSEYLTTGPAVDAFEAKLKDITGAEHAVACANGTAALHLAALVLELKPNECVVVPSVTFLATANAAHYVGAEVIFADVDANTGLMGPDHLEDALTRADGRVRAVFPVHLGGRFVDMPEIAKIAQRNGLAVVEDACHALGGSVCEGSSWFAAGSCRHADMATFSFHPVKTVTMGEGGAITTNDAEFAARLRRTRNHGMLRDAAEFANHDLAFATDGSINPWYYEMDEPGFNYRASDIQCALGTSQLNKLPAFHARRAALAARYDHLLTQMAPIVRPVPYSDLTHPGWHLYGVLIDFAAIRHDRASVMNRLTERGIGTQVHYIPVHLQPAYRAAGNQPDLPGARAYYDRCLSLPLFPAMTEHDVDRIVAGLAEALA